MTAPAYGPTRAHLPDTPEIYVLGPLEDPLLMLNVTDDYGCAWLVDEPAGWDAPEFVTPIDSRQDGHGGFAGITTFPPRVLTFDGIVSCPDPAAARAARRRLIAALSSNLAGHVLYTQLDDDPAKSLWCKPSGKVRAEIPDGYAVVFSFTLVAENPLKFGTSSVYGTARLPTAAGQPGRVYPRTYTVRYDIPSQVLTEIRRNRAPNPRVAASTSSWFGNAGLGGVAPSTRLTTGGPDDGSYFRLTYTTANNTAAGASPLASIVVDGRAASLLPIPVAAGTVYSAAIYTRTSIEQRVAARIAWYDAAGAVVGVTAAGPATVTAPNTWTRLTVEAATAPAGATHARVEVATTAGAGAAPFPVGATFDATMTTLEAADVAGDYFDGSTPDTSLLDYGWTGAANASPSTQSAVATLGSAVRRDVVAVPNVGDEWADAIYHLTGPVPQPRVELSTGEFLGLSADLTGLDVLEVDTRSGTVRVNGVNRADVLLAGSTFPQIPPGGTEVRLRSQAGGEDPAAGLTVTTAPTWK